jgi:carbon-monoxide dehydrogenase medium subunit
LVALDAMARVQSPTGAREIAIADLITDFYETSLAPDEIVTEVRVPLLPAGARAAHLKYITRSSEDRPCVGATAILRLDDQGNVADLRVAVGAIAGRPLRLPAVEATARRQRPTDDLFRQVAASYAEAADPLSDVRGSAAYRKQMVSVFVRRALQEARDGAGGARKC